MGFIYGGISSQSMKIKARLTNWQTSPSLRNAFVTVPGKSGVADFGCDIAERIITVRCSVYPQRNFAELVAVLDSMAEWLNPVKGLKQLVLDDVPERYFMARLSESVDCERVLRSAGSFDLRFVCPDPYAYALDDETFTISTEGGHVIERQVGNANSESVYFLKGVVTSSSSSYIDLITNGKELRVVGPLAEGETLVIDTGLVTAKVTDAGGNTLRNGLPCLQELNFPILRKGINNIEITVGDATFTELKIQAQSRWR